MSSIGIIGAGVSGLHLAISLRDAGIAATLYSPQTPEALEVSRMTNSVAHMNDTIERERQMDIEFWDRSNARVCEYREYHVQLPDGTVERSRGSLNGDERCVDYRLYLPRLMREFVKRGGDLQVTSVTANNFDELFDRHQLLAIGVGRKHDGFGDYFPRIDELSIHGVPQRLLCAGLYTGVKAPDPLSVTLNISVGHGELIELPMETHDGERTALLFECKQDGNLTDLSGIDYTADPDAFNRRILEVLEQHYKQVYNRVDCAHFGLTGSSNLLQGAVQPITRRSWSEIGDGRYAMAIGDLRCTQDPLTGQGANLGSYGAVELARHINESDGVFDKNFCERYESRVAYRTAGVVNFNNALLDPNTYQRALIHRFPHDRALCDDFSARFSRPESLWFDILKDEQTCADYIARFDADQAVA